MSKTSADWATMTAEERRKFSEEQKVAAIKAVETDGFPTGLKVTIGGKEYIARPVRQTDSGGVTYSITARPATVGKYAGRFNKFSFTLLGSGAAGSEVAFEEENLM